MDLLELDRTILRRTAFHEAGHAVMAHVLFGWPVHHVSTLPQHSEGYFGKTEVTAPAGHVWDTAFLREFVVYQMAGHAATAIAENGADSLAWDQDIEDAMISMLLAHSGLDLASILARRDPAGHTSDEIEKIESALDYPARMVLLEAARDRARRILEEPLNWRTGEKIARTLIERRELTEEEIRVLLSEMSESSSVVSSSMT